MIDVIWNAIVGVGAVIGLLTGAYVLLERWTKDYPSVFIFAKPLSDFGRRSLYLRVANRSERPILVTMSGRPQPGQFRVARDHSTHAILVALYHEENTYGIDGKTEVDMPLMMPNGVNDDAYEMDSSIEMVVRWRYAQPILLQGDRKIRVTSSKRNLRALLGLGPDEMI